MTERLPVEGVKRGREIFVSSSAPLPQTPKGKKKALTSPALLSGALIFGDGPNKRKQIPVRKRKARCNRFFQEEAREEDRREGPKKGVAMALTIHVEAMSP